MSGAQNTQNGSNESSAGRDPGAESVIIAAADGTVEAVSAAFEDTFGCSVSEVRGRHVLFFCDGVNPESVLAGVRDAMVESGRWRGELSVRRANGDLFPADVRIRSVSDAAGSARMVLTVRDISDSRAAKNNPPPSDDNDGLTGLPSRAGMMRLLFRIMSSQGGANAKIGCAVLVLDIDNFRQVNERFGHGVGDRILIDQCRRLQANLRDRDALGRIGGNKYLALLPRCKSVEEVEIIAKRLLEAVSEPFSPEGHSETVQLSASLGISLYPQDGSTPQGLVQGAESAREQAKSAGPGKYRVVVDGESLRARDSASPEERLRKAITEDQLVLHYQPKIDPQTMCIVGAEALVRWRDPEFGLVPPSDFIPIAEETGLIAPLGMWAIETACNEAMRLQSIGLDVGRMAVNMSPRQISDPDMVGNVLDILKRTGLSAESLELEITESVLLDRAETAKTALRALREHGVHIVADDFGTGYASLSYLLTFPIDAIKIDRSFVAEIGGAGEGSLLAIGVTAFTKSMNKRVVAEGVETSEQFEVMKNQQCDEVQGFYFSPPVSASRFEILLRAQPQTPART
ncbi:MAG: sensor domain-containing protein [Rhodospirillales bacterium]